MTTTTKTPPVPTSRLKALEAEFGKRREALPIEQLRALDRSHADYPAKVDNAFAHALDAAERERARVERYQRIKAEEFRSGRATPWANRETTDGLLGQAIVRLAELSEAVAAISRLCDDWSRFYLVTNANGHVHKSRRCRTCTPRTRFAFLPLLSGSTDDEIVAHFGVACCTVCFPDAPTDPRYVADLEGLQREAERRASEKCAGSTAQLEARRVYGSRGICPVCKRWVSVDLHGNVRSHKAPASA